MGSTFKRNESTDKTRIKENSTGYKLYNFIEECLKEHFLVNNKEDIVGLYNSVLSMVEESLFKTTINYLKGNQTKSARMLGISRGTLRKKMALYQINSAKNKKK